MSDKFSVVLGSNGWVLSWYKVIESREFFFAICDEHFWVMRVGKGIVHYWPVRDWKIALGE